MRRVNPWGRRLLTILAACVPLAGGCRDVTAPSSGIHAADVAQQSVGSAGTVEVSPASLQGWRFGDDGDERCVDAGRCRFVEGPAGAPLGSGSVELASTARHGASITLDAHRGTRLARISALQYSTRRDEEDDEDDDGVAVSLQLGIDYDLSDTAEARQGWIVYEPALRNAGDAGRARWQRWDAREGRWWGTAPVVHVRGGPAINRCLRWSPCTWKQLVARYPAIGIHKLHGSIALRARPGAPFRGSADALAVGIDGAVTHFDFERTSTASAESLFVRSDPGVTGTPVDGDSAFARGAVVPYAFHGAGDGRQLRVYLDGVLAPDSGTVVMDGSHSLLVALAEDLSMQPGDRPLHDAIRAVLDAAEPVAAFRALLAAVGASDDDVGLDETALRMRRASAAAIDLDRDAAALQRVDAALGGQELEAWYVLPERGPSVTRLGPPGRGVRNVVAAGRVPNADPTVFVYVNGIGNLFTDAAETVQGISKLLRETGELRDTADIHVRLSYNRNYHTETQAVGDQLRCMNALRPDVQGMIDYARCRKMNPLRLLASIAQDLLELRRLLGSGTAPAGAAADIDSLRTRVLRYRAAGRNVVLAPHSEGNVIVRRALEGLATDPRFPPNGTPTCVAVVPMASPTTRYGPIGARYVKPVQLEGDIILISGLALPAVDNFPASPSPLNDRLRAARARIPVGTLLLALRDGGTVHGMSSYLHSAGGRPYLYQALLDAHAACAVQRVDLERPAGDSLLLGETRQYAAIAFNGAGDRLSGISTAWSTTEGISVSESGLVTATGLSRDGEAGVLTSGYLVARVLARTAEEYVRVWSKPPVINAVTCTKGGTRDEHPVWVTPYSIVVDAVPSHPRARIRAYVKYVTVPFPKIDGGPQTHQFVGFDSHAATIDIEYRKPFMDDGRGWVGSDRFPEGSCSVTVVDIFNKRAVSSSP